MVVAVAGIVACCFTASAQTVIFSDNYKGADGDLDSASLVDRTSGLDASGVLPQSTSAQQTIAGGKLQLVCRGGAKSGTSGGMHFGTIGSPGTLWDWSSGAGGSAITKAGGMSVSFNWTANDTTAQDWLFLATGADSADSYGTNWKLLAIAAANSSGILLQNCGVVEVWHAGVFAASNTFAATGVSHSVKLDYQFDSWEVGAPVTLNVFVDGKFMISDTFSWLYGPGSQYMVLGTYQENNRVDSFNVSTYTGTISSGFSPATFVNKGELPWGDHKDTGTEWYSPTNSYGQPCVTMSNNVLTLTSYHIVQNGLHYQSGVVYANIDVPNSGYNYVTLDVDMYTPFAGTAGCWPMFWLDSAWTWPPEVDVAEFKGSAGGGNVWQNVNGGGKWSCTVGTIDPTKWHHYGVVLGPPANGARTYQLYFDGAVRAQGAFVDKQGVPFCVIFNYAMEGASGSPGPTDTTYIQARNWKMAIH
jgi:hypothetical protein